MIQALAAVPIIGKILGWATGLAGALSNPLVIAGIGTVSTLGGYTYGHIKGRAEGRAIATMKAENASLQQKLAAEKIDRIAAQDAAQGTIAALEQETVARERVEREIQTYANELAKRTHAPACRLDGNDIKRLRGFSQK